MNILNPGPKVTDADVVGIEAATNCRLPESYKNFLIMYNGGQPTPDCISIEGLDGEPTDVQVFFGIGRAGASDLMWNINELGRLLPKGHIPIACDSGGNVFCISCLGGEVLYAELFDTPPRFHRVASSLNAFCEALTLDEPKR